jgi:hypothetical protein
MVVAVGLMLLGAGCDREPATVHAAEPGAGAARLLVELPPHLNTPDGMCLLADGSILVSVPNVNDESSPAKIMRITSENRLEPFIDPPPHPETGKAYPFGICVDPATGDVYYGDLQWFAGRAANYKSRVIRIPMNGSVPGVPEVFAEGMVVCNAVAIHGGYLYTSDTSMMPDTKPMISGVFRFKLGEKGHKVTQPLDRDPHLVATIETQHPTVGFGADGLCFDRSGNLYIGNFADGTLHKVVFDAQGNPTTAMPTAVWARAAAMKSCDGLFYDTATDTIYVADSMANAVQAVTLDGQVRTVASEASDDGKGGKLDQPCEVLIRNGKLVVSNFDMPIEGGVNQRFETPNCISEIELAR